MSSISIPVISMPILSIPDITMPLVGMSIGGSRYEPEGERFYKWDDDSNLLWDDEQDMTY